MLDVFSGYTSPGQYCMLDVFTWLLGSYMKLPPTHGKPRLPTRGVQARSFGLFVLLVLTSKENDLVADGMEAAT